MTCRRLSTRTSVLALVLVACATADSAPACTEQITRSPDHWSVRIPHPRTDGCGFCVINAARAATETEARAACEEALTP